MTVGAAADKSVSMRTASRFLFPLLFLLSGALGAYACDPEGCFSPSQNLDRAYDDGAVGCSCGGGDDVCARDSEGRSVALVCESGNWIAAEDGPCTPIPPPRP